MFLLATVLFVGDVGNTSEPIDTRLRPPPHPISRIKLDMTKAEVEKLLSDKPWLINWYHIGLGNSRTYYKKSGIVVTYFRETVIEFSTFDWPEREYWWGKFDPRH